MIRKILIISLMFIGMSMTLQAQGNKRPEPKIWFGVSGAANLNLYSGTTQTLNSTVIAPSAFHDGFGASPYASILFEYRPTSVVGFMLNLGYDGRGGTFNKTMAPCNCPADLISKISYLSVEPSLRIAPFSSAFYMFLGGGYSYNLGKDFVYTQELQPDRYSEFSSMHTNSFSTHVGFGFDIPLASVNSTTQVNLSPFIMYKPYFGQNPRSIESWSISTVRVGIAIKFGKTRAIVHEEHPYVAPVAPVVYERGTQFSIQAPTVIPVQRIVRETFPIRNYVFFDKGSSEIPKRYDLLNREKASYFKESQFQQPEPYDINRRSDRQLNAYYNILNILGDRMRLNPNTNVTLIGASAGDGIDLGLQYAESVKLYLVNVFDINPDRIKTEGRNQPVLPSEQPGGTKFLTLLREGDRRVDIVSSSMILIAPLQISVIQQDPEDSRVVFKTENGTNISLKTWSLEIRDEKGITQYYGPYTKSQESISGNIILQDRMGGDFIVAFVGETKDGNIIRKESTLHLLRNQAPIEESYRFSILFDFDTPKATETYDKFLTEVVAPIVPDYGKVIIHGHTDIIGEEEYNMNLSVQRAQDARRILEQALIKAGKTNVIYKVTGFGADTNNAPFDNGLPEERFYNRTVIIDIILNK